MTDAAQEKARALRWKRPMSKSLNWRTILETLDEIAEEAEGIRWMEDEDIEAALGDEEEAWEFKTAFSDLSADCERFREDLDDVRRYDFISADADEEDEASLFDLFFPAVGATGGMYGFDEYEEDYFPIDAAQEEYAQKEAAKRLKRLTKDQLLDAAGMCLRIAQQFISIRYRHDCLSAALDILKGEQAGLLKIVKGIEDAYEKAEADTFGFKFYAGHENAAFDRMLLNLPERMWIE